MTKDAELIRVSQAAKALLKTWAAKEGRTMEWAASEAIYQLTAGMKPEPLPTNTPTPTITKGAPVNEQPCCSNETCKHWSWIGDGYQNSLSGRVREAGL